MQTYPSGPNTKKIADYSTEDRSVVFTVSRRSGGIGRDDYLITGTNGFSATRLTRDKAIEAALTEIGRLNREAKHAQTS